MRGGGEAEKGRDCSPTPRSGPAPRSTGSHSCTAGGVGGADRGGISSLTEGGPRQYLERDEPGWRRQEQPRSVARHSLYGHREPLSENSPQPPRRTSRLPLCRPGPRLRHHEPLAAQDRPGL